MGRGSVMTLGFFVGIVITIAILVPVGFLISNALAGGGEQKLSDAKEEFLDISKFYKGCAENPKADCFCGSIDVSRIKDWGYALHLNKVLGQSRLILTESSVWYGDEGLIERDDVLEESSFNEDFVCTFGYDGSAQAVEDHRAYDMTHSGLALDMGGKVPVLKIDSKVCVYEPAEDLKLEMLMHDFSSCGAALDSDKLVLLDSAGADSGARQIAAHLEGYLYRDVGRVDAFFKGDRVEWFDGVYADEKEDYLAAKLFLIHLETSIDVAPASEGLTDRIVMHYLEGSVVGESFAEAVGLRLKNLKGRYYHDSVEESSVGNVPENFRFNTEVVYEANSIENPGDVYLVCGVDELPICRENLQVPAVFIEVVEADDGYSAYQGHEEIIAKAIKDGVLDYVKHPSVYEYIPEAADESLFQ